MPEGLKVGVRIAEPSGEYSELSGNMIAAGHLAGRARYGEKWEGKCVPSEEKLRIYRPPETSGGLMTIDAVPFGWSDLQAYRQLQPVGAPSEDDPMSYWLNAVALTANALIQTEDGKLVFHRKKGGAKPGSIHAFGGYVKPEDGGIEAAIARELMEGSETGLGKGEFEVGPLFGTPEGKPSILWDFGTGAVYGVVRARMAAAQMQERMAAIPADESLSKGLYVVDLADVRKLEGLDDLHPQTRRVLPTIEAMYS